jgi:hypothetical protein
MTDPTASDEAQNQWTVEGPDIGGYHRIVKGAFHVLCPTSIIDPILADLNSDEP